MSWFETYMGQMDGRTEVTMSYFITPRFYMRLDFTCSLTLSVWSSFKTIKLEIAGNWLMGHYDANVPIKPATPGRFVLVRVSAEMNPSKLVTTINGPIISLTIIFTPFWGTEVICFHLCLCPSYLFYYLLASVWLVMCHCWNNVMLNFASC